MRPSMPGCSGCVDASLYGMSFDSAFELHDIASFQEMSSLVLLNGLSIRAIVAPRSSYRMVSDGRGGFSRDESQSLEVLSSDVLANGVHTGQLVVIPTTPPQQYRVQQIRSNGYTATLICGATSGTSVQF